MAFGRHCLPRLREDKLIAVVKYPYSKPETIEIDKGYKALQKIVEGIITSADLPNMEDIHGYANDEGLLIGMEPNIYRPEWNDALVGPIVFLGDGGEGDSVSLTPEQVKKVVNYLEANNVANFTEFLINIETEFANYKPKKVAEM